MNNDANCFVVGEAMKTVLFIIDLEIIIFGGSVSKAVPYF